MSSPAPLRRVEELEALVASRQADANAADELGRGLFVDVCTSTALGDIPPEWITERLQTCGGVFEILRAEDERRGGGGQEATGKAMGWLSLAALHVRKGQLGKACDEFDRACSAWLSASGLDDAVHGGIEVAAPRARATDVAEVLVRTRLAAVERRTRSWHRLAALADVFMEMVGGRQANGSDRAVRVLLPLVGSEYLPIHEERGIVAELELQAVHGEPGSFESSEPFHEADKAFESALYDAWEWVLGQPAEELPPLAVRWRLRVPQAGRVLLRTRGSSVGAPVAAGLRLLLDGEQADRRYVVTGGIRRDGYLMPLDEGHYEAKARAATGQEGRNLIVPAKDCEPALRAWEAAGGLSHPAGVRVIPMSHADEVAHELCAQAGTSNGVSGVLAAIPMVCAALGILLFYFENSRLPGMARFVDPISPAVALTFPLVGVFIASRPSGRVVGSLLVAAGGLLGVSFFLEQVGISLLACCGSPARWLLWAGSWSWIPASVIPVTLLPLLFPDGSPPSGRWRLVGWSIVALVAAATILVGLAPENPYSPLSALGPGESTAPLGTWPPQLLHVGSALLDACVLVLGPVAFAALVVRWLGRGEDKRDRRRQLNLVVVAFGINLGSVLAARTGVLPTEVAQWTVMLTLVGIPATVLVSMLRPGSDYEVTRFEKDALLTDALASAGHVLCAVVFFLGIAGLLTLLSVRRPVGSVIGVIVVAVTFPFLKRRLWRLSALLGRPQEASAMTVLVRVITEHAHPEAVPLVVTAIRDIHGFPFVGVEIFDEAGNCIAEASQGTGTEWAFGIPLVHRNMEVGRFTVEPLVAGAGLTRYDRRLLRVYTRLLTELAWKIGRHRERPRAQR